MFNWPDGKIYDGGWKNDVPHGKATFIYEDGMKQIGVYENGKRISKTDYNDFKKAQDEKKMVFLAEKEEKKENLGKKMTKVPVTPKGDVKEKVD